MSQNHLTSLATMLLRVALGIMFSAHSRYLKLLVFTLPGTGVGPPVDASGKHQGQDSHEDGYLDHHTAQKHQGFGYFDSVNPARHHLFQHAWPAKFVKVSGEEVQYDKDPEHREEHAWISLRGVHIKPFLPHDQQQIAALPIQPAASRASANA